MRGLRSTLILLVVLIGLAGYIYFVDSTRPVGEEAAKEKVFTGVTADEIEEITIKADDGERSTLRKADGAWKLAEPAGVDVDEGEVSAITSALPDLEIQRVVEENAADLKRYGLDPARIEVGFRTDDSQEMQRLLIGERTATGGEIYARRPDGGRVILLSSFLDSTFNKNTFALRDKRVLAFERDKVTSLELTNGKQTLQFAKKGTEWRLTRPIDARADFGAVEGIVERLNSLRMQSIVSSEEEPNLRQYGLATPTATITVGSGSARASLILGTTENALVHAKDVSRPLIFTVAPTITEDLFKPVDELRRKDLFDARAFTATRAEFRRGDEVVTLEKTKGTDDADVWKNAAGADVDAMKVDDLLSRVTGLRADSFVATRPAALQKPASTVTLRYDEGAMETVRFARGGTDVFASREDEPGAARVAASSFDEAIAALDAMK